MAYYHSTAIGGKSAQGCLEYSGNVARGGNQLGNEMIAERDTDGVVPKHTGDGTPCGKIVQKRSEMQMVWFLNILATEHRAAKSPRS
jgi:hypothetical protein